MYTLVQNFDNRGGYGYVEAGSIWKICTLQSICCELKKVLKNIVYFYSYLRKGKNVQLINSFFQSKKRATNLFINWVTETY